MILFYSGEQHKIFVGECEVSLSRPGRFCGYCKEDSPQHDRGKAESSRGQTLQVRIFLTK